MDAAANGEFDSLSTQGGWDLINKMAARAMNFSGDRQNRRGVMEIEAYDRMIESNRKLSQQMTALQQQFLAAQIASIHCGTCGGPHASEDCGADFEEEVKVMGNSQNNPYSNTYNVGCNHPNFSWKEQGNSGQRGNFQRPYHNNQKLQGQSSKQQQYQEHSNQQPSLHGQESGKVN